MKHEVLLLSFYTCACCGAKLPVGDEQTAHCPTDLAFTSQLSEQTTEGKEVLNKVASDAKYADPDPANAEAWCAPRWNDNVIGIFCSRQVDRYCEKNCSAGGAHTDCAQEAARTKLTERCAHDSVGAFLTAAPQCKALSLCGDRLMARCTPR